ncbi:hypothetical protein LOS20_09695 [Enterococcus faecium]|nr:hypothetical protein [Enterococcus faecium]
MGNNVIIGIVIAIIIVAIVVFLVSYLMKKKPRSIGCLRKTQGRII